MLSATRWGTEVKHHYTRDKAALLFRASVVLGEYDLGGGAWAAFWVRGRPVLQLRMPESRPLRRKKHSNKDVHILERHTHTHTHTHTQLQLRMPESRPLSIARSKKECILYRHTHTHTCTQERERERERPDARETLRIAIKAFKWERHILERHAHAHTHKRERYKEREKGKTHLRLGTDW